MYNAGYSCLQIHDQIDHQGGLLMWTSRPELIPVFAGHVLHSCDKAGLQLRIPSRSRFGLLSKPCASLATRNSSLLTDEIITHSTSQQPRQFFRMPGSSSSWAVTCKAFIGLRFCYPKGLHNYMGALLKQFAQTSQQSVLLLQIRVCGKSPDLGDGMF